MADAVRVARVVLETPLPQLDRLFDYGVPAEFAAQALPGVRVKVPLRSAGRIATGFIVEVADASDYDGALSPIDSVVSAAPVLSPEVWGLARAVADRGAGSAADVLRLAIPPRRVRAEKAWLKDAEKRGEAAGPPVPPPAPLEGYPAGELERLLDADARIALAARPECVLLPGLPDDAGAADGASGAADDVWIGHWAVTVARAALRCAATGRSALIAVPDHRDLDQLHAALLRLGAAGLVARLDAGRGATERYAAFLDCLAGPRIVIGNRSALLAPASRLGLIVVWDDGDPLHAEPLAPYPHDRDVALVRQSRQGGALVFASHTRSVEVARLVGLGWLTAVDPSPRRTPRIILSSGQAEGDPRAAAARIPSAAWRQAADALATGPVLVQVARPGYAPALACARCRSAARCTVCDGPLGTTSAAAAPACRWCGRIAAGWECPQCSGRELRMVTIGSSRTAEELGRAFAGSRVIVADGEHPVLRVPAAPALVVATRGAEPIADGGYRAVLLLDGDRMLARESLRIGEDCLRWWSNAAALAAPGAPVVLVGVGGALAQSFATWRQDRYAAGELADRRDLHLPPAARVASVTGAPAAVEAALAALDAGLVIDTLGPVPVGDGLVRAIIRMEYAAAARAAVQLRAAIVRNATHRRRAPAGRGWRSPPTLRVRFDDPEIL